MLEGIAITAFGSVLLTGLISGFGTLATIITILLGIGGLAGIVFSVRFRVATEVFKATAQAQAENASAERERADRLERQLEESHERERDHRETIAKFEALPNLSKVIEQITSIDTAAAARTETAVAALLERFDARFEASERRANDRHLQTTNLFKTLGDALADLAREFIDERKEP